MGQHSEAFIGIDTSKLKNAVAVAESGRDGEVRYLGEFDTTDAATRKWIGKLAAKYSKLTLCYEAGPTGYGLHRLIEGLGHRNIVVAPSLTIAGMVADEQEWRGCAGIDDDHRRWVAVAQQFGRRWRGFRREFAQIPILPIHRVTCRR